MKMKESQFLLIKEQLKKLTSKECFYKQKLEGVSPRRTSRSSHLPGRATCGRPIPWA